MLLGHACRHASGAEAHQRSLSDGTATETHRVTHPVIDHSLTHYALSLSLTLTLRVLSSSSSTTSWLMRADSAALADRAALPSKKGFRATRTQTHNKANSRSQRSSNHNFRLVSRHKAHCCHELWSEAAKEGYHGSTYDCHCNLEPVPGVKGSTMWL